MGNIMITIASKDDCHNDSHFDCNDDNCQCISCKEERKYESQMQELKDSGYPVNYWKYSQSQIYMC